MTSLIPVHKWTCITTRNNGKHKTTQKKFLPTHMNSHGGHRARRTKFSVKGQDRQETRDTTWRTWLRHERGRGHNT